MKALVRFPFGAASVIEAIQKEHDGYYGKPHGFFRMEPKDVLEFALFASRNSSKDISIPKHFYAGLFLFEGWTGWMTSGGNALGVQEIDKKVTDIAVVGVRHGIPWWILDRAWGEGEWESKGEVLRYLTWEESWAPWETADDHR